MLTASTMGQMEAFAILEAAEDARHTDRSVDGMR